MRNDPMAATKAADEWNEAWPVGTEVIVRRDNGTDTATTTMSEAWVLPSGVAVVKRAGISGGYLLDRVRPKGESDAD